MNLFSLNIIYTLIIVFVTSFFISKCTKILVLEDVQDGRYIIEKIGYKIEKDSIILYKLTERPIYY